MDSKIAYAKLALYAATTAFISIACFVLFVVARSFTETPLPSTGTIAGGAECSVWSDGVLTCNVHNPSRSVVAIAATVEFDCSAKVSKRVYSSQPYRETVVVEDVPEQGWSATAISSDGFTRFYKGVQNQLASEAEKVVDLAQKGGLTAADLTEEQRKYIARTPLDVCAISGVSARYTNARRSNLGPALLAALKTLMK